MLLRGISCEQLGWFKKNYLFQSRKKVYKAGIFVYPQRKIQELRIIPAYIKKESKVYVANKSEPKVEARLLHLHIQICCYLI